jgi:hypothetical protein
MSDAPDYYSFNPHCTDTRGPQNSTRRLMFGWIEGGMSQAVAAARVPYWQSAHSLMREVTVAGASIVQTPAKGSFEPLRASAAPHSVGPIAVSKDSGGNYLPSVKGDALELLATFAGNATASSFGLILRLGGSHAGCRVSYAPAARRISGATSSDITSQSDGQIELHVFLDREWPSKSRVPRTTCVALTRNAAGSIIEVYSAGVALTQRCLLPKGVTGSAALQVDLFATNGQAHLLQMQAWSMKTMWQPVM